MSSKRLKRFSGVASRDFYEAFGPLQGGPSGQGLRPKLHQNAHLRLTGDHLVPLQVEHERSLGNEVRHWLRRYILLGSLRHVKRQLMHGTESERNRI